MKKTKPSAESLQNFDALMRGLIQVSRKELQEQLKKSKPSRSTRRK
jgi:hypothetical protein